MSTRIDIEVAQAILSQRAKEIAELNRQQRLERERKIKDEAAIKAATDKGAEAALRNGNPSGGQAIGGAAALDARAQRLGLRSGVPEYYTPPKVAAQARRTGFRMGVAFVNANPGGSSAPGTLPYVVYSGQQNASTSGSWPNPDRTTEWGPVDFDHIFYINTWIQSTIHQRFMLPVSGSKCIYVDWRRSQATLESNVWYSSLGFPEGSPTPSGTGARLESTSAGAEVVTESLSCFLVTSKTVRQIGAPLAFKSLLNSLAPPRAYIPVTGTSGPYEYYGGYGADPGVDGAPSINIETHFPSRFRLEGWATSTTTDASVFKCLSDWANAPHVGYDGTTVFNLRAKTLAFLSAEPVPNQSFGYGKLAGTVTSERIGFDLNKAPDVFPSVWERYPRSDVATAFNGSGIPVSLYSTWDWGKPAYCGQQLLALGFTPADLQP